MMKKLHLLQPLIKLEFLLSFCIFFSIYHSSAQITTFPVGSLPGNIDVSSSGAAVYTIPLEVVPGTQGTQPNLSLYFNNQSGWGPLGLKWNISGLSAISRVPQTLYHDENSTGVNLTSQDRYALDGNRLILIEGSEYGGDNSKYAPEIENFSRVTSYGNVGSGPEYFEVIDDAGNIMEYGKTTDSRQLLGNNVLTWMINKITDPDGYYMTFHYTRASGDILIDHIDYSGNSHTGLTPYASVKFKYYNATKGKNTVFIGGQGINQSRLLNDISILYENQVVRKYKFLYEVSGTPRLFSIILESENGTRINSTNISWGKKENSMSLQTLTDPGQSDVITGDFNGDGLTDLVYYNIKKNDQYYWQLFLANTSGSFHYQCEGIHNGEETVHFRAGDFNNDGCDELLIGERWGLSNTIYIGRYITFSNLNAPKETSLGQFNELLNILTGDFDGNGTCDMMFVEKLGNRIVAKFRGVDAPPLYLVLDVRLHLCDFNGNGKVNFQTTSGQWTITYEYNSITGQFEIIHDDQFPQVGHEVYYGDFNGDGLEDLLCYSNGEWSMWIAKGDGKYTWPGYIFPYNTLNNRSYQGTGKHFYPVIIGDFNGDGKDDIVQLVSPDAGGMIFKVFYTEGFYNNSYSYSQQEFSFTEIRGHELRKYRIGDFNGDGKLDLYYRQSISNPPYVIYFNRNETFSQVNSIKDGYGNSVKLTYHNKFLRAFDYSHTQRKGNKLFLTTVNTIQYSNGLNNGFNTDTYEFTSPIFSSARKQFLGFISTKIKNTQSGIEKTATNLYDTELQTLSIRNEITKLGNKTLRNRDLFYRIVNFSHNRFLPYISDEYNEDFLENKKQTSVSVFNNEGRIQKNTVEIKKSTDAAYKMQNVTSYSYTTINLPNGISKRVPFAVVTTKRIAGSTAAKSHTVQYAYSGGRILSVSESNSDGTRKTSFVYNSSGLIQKKSFAASQISARTEEYTYDNTGRFVTSVKNPLGHTISSTYDPKTGNLLLQTDANTLLTSYEYDHFGNLIRTVYPDNNESTFSTHWYTGTAIPNAKFYTVTSASGMAPVTIYYDGLGRELCSEAQSVYRDTRYNAKGQIIKASYPYTDITTVDSKKIWNEFTYDEYGRILQETGPYKKMAYTYSPGKVIIRDNLRNMIVSEKEYDVAGQLITSKDPGGAINYNYEMVTLNNKTRNKVTITYNNATTTIITDLYDNRLELHDPNAGLIKSTYNGCGEIISQTDANNNVITFQYDNLGRITQKLYNNSNSSERIDYIYDYYATAAKGRGKIKEIRLNGATSASFTYDELGRLKTENKLINGGSYPHTYSYNNFGFLSGITYPDNFGIEYGYNENGEITAIKRKDDGKYIYQVHTRNKYGQTVRSSYGNGIYSERSYNDYGILTGIMSGNKTNRPPGGIGIATLPDAVFPSLDPGITPPSELPYYVGNEYQGLTYQYNNLGLMSKRTNINNGQADNFRYDHLDRLQGWLSGSQYYSYNNNGNIANNIQFGSYRYQSDKPYAVNEITAGNNVTPVSSSDCDVEYNMYHQPVRITQGTYRLQLYYGVDQQRNRTVLYENNRIKKTKHFISKWYEKESVQTGTTTTATRHLNYIYGPDGVVAILEKNALQDAGTMYYIHTDHLGSYNVITDQSKNVVESFHFDPWGNRKLYNRWDTDDTRTAFLFDRGFTGHEHLDCFRIINMNSRLYDPVNSRFFSPDPYVQMPDFSQNFNRYSYCLNNPLRYTDPTGEFIWLLPNISWSKNDGLSIGLTFAVGIPGLFSAHASVGYNIQNNDFSTTLGVTAAMNTLYGSYSTQSGFSIGWSAGFTPQSGFPFSTNLGSMGANYNITHGILSSNISAFNFGPDGWNFNPSVSATILPEHFTNLVRGQGFRNNDAVLSRFVANGQQQKALNYFGFKGAYDPNHRYFKEEVSPGATNPKTGEIFYHSSAFEKNFDYLALVAHHELTHRRRILSGNFDPNNLNREEWGTYMTNYRNQGLYPNYGNDLEVRINTYGLWSGIYQIPGNRFTSQWWHFIYKIPRLW